MLCLRCPEKNRKPNETEKRVDGVPVCSTCYLEDAKANLNRAKDYYYLKNEAPVYVKEPKRTKK